MEQNIEEVLARVDKATKEADDQSQGLGGEHMPHAERQEDHQPAAKSEAQENGNRKAGPADQQRSTIDVLMKGIGEDKEEPATTRVIEVVQPQRGEREPGEIVRENGDTHIKADPNKQAATNSRALGEETPARRDSSSKEEDQGMEQQGHPKQRGRARKVTRNLAAHPAPKRGNIIQVGGKLEERPSA